ncbi:nitroreductase family deazaflavin-dependent oxidoreductase [Amycolatopsis magusensis]|uniref:nitroreductase family deazaflavin-dependent oxidoreductase n=1 Tax=Amycolatopsis magusensis TaxID=882444 RepID=UPI0037B12080
MTLTARPPRGLLRALLRAPLLAYRAHLGFLFGHRLVHLVHIGRKSGRLRDVVLEVVRYGPGEIVVVAGWGARADWLRNLRVAPAYLIESGRTRWPAPRHRYLDADETLRLLVDYRARHPRAWRRLAPTLGMPVDPRDAEGPLPQAVAFSPG